MPKSLTQQLQDATLAKLERFRSELDDRVAALIGSTHSVETLTDGQFDTCKRVVKLWAQQAAAAYHAGQPISNAVALSTANLVLNEKDTTRHIPRRKRTRFRHVDRLAYTGILLGDSAAKNAATGYTLPLWAEAAAPGKRVYFLTPGLCAWETLPEDARMVCESPSGSLDVREMSALRQMQQAGTHTGQIGVTKPPAPPPPGEPGAPAPSSAPIWQTTIGSLTRESNRPFERERGESGTLPVFAAAAGAANTTAKAYAPGAQYDPQSEPKHKTPEVASAPRKLTERQAAAAKFANEWPHHARQIQQTAAELVQIYRERVELHNPQAVPADHAGYWHQVEAAAFQTLCWKAETNANGYKGQGYTAFEQLATEVCTNYLPEKIAAGRWQVMVSARQFFTCEGNNYNLIAAIKGCEKWLKKHPKDTNSPEKNPKKAKNSPKNPAKVWDKKAQNDFMAEYTGGNISLNVLKVWANLCEIHPGDALIAAADLRAWRLALIELCRLHDPALVWQVINWWLGCADDKNNAFMLAAKRRRFWAQNGGCKSLTGLRKRFAIMVAQFHEDEDEWKKAPKKRGIDTTRIVPADAPAPTSFPGQKSGRIKWDETFMRDWEGTRTGNDYAAALQAADFFKVTDQQAGQRSALGYRYVHSKSGEARKYLES